MKQRTRQLGLRIVRLVESLPNTRTADIIGRQLLRCGLSVGANYRAACRGKSRADFAAKMGIVEEEADEIIYWIEMLIDCDLVKRSLVEALLVKQTKLWQLWFPQFEQLAKIAGVRESNQQSEFRNPQFHYDLSSLRL